MKPRALFSLALIAFSLLAVGCGPRGETQTLTQILEAERNRLRAVEGNAAEPAKAQLGALVGKLASLETITDKSQAQLQAGEVATMLAALTDHAGFTSRPAFAEVTAQYRTLSQSSEMPAVPAAGEGLANVRLLVSRTYSMLSSELESTKFAL